MTSNFDFLEKYWPQLAQLGRLAEMYLFADANSCIMKLGMLAEMMAAELCVRENIALPEDAAHIDRLRALRAADLLPAKVDELFHAIRRARNAAAHAGLDSTDAARRLLPMAWHLSVWLMRVYGDWDFEPAPWHEPEQAETADLAAVLCAQETQIGELTAAVAALPTPAAHQADAERPRHAADAAENLPEVESIPGEGKIPMRIDVSALPLVNYALHHNGVPAIRSIVLENRSGEDIENAEVRITATPDFALPYIGQAERISAGRSVTLKRPKLLLNADFLAGVTERIAGTLTVEVRGDNAVLAVEHVEMAVEAFEQWHGLRLYPEMLASFVTPNHPALAPVIARATEYLGAWTGDTSMDAYQTQDRDRVLRQAAALFTALKEQAIAYVVSPPSFEKHGQRIRLCDAVLRQKMGTCLDLSLLYAACLEAVGLHPVLVHTAGHMFVGLWLEDRIFPETVQDDVSLLTKRLASGVNEMAVVEATCLTTGGDRSFDDARAAAEKNLATQDLELLIDVRRARLSGVLPLPQRVHTDGGWVVCRDASFDHAKMTAPRALDETIDVTKPGPEENIPRKQQWERKLLDLGLRNTLINLRLNRTQLPLLSGDIEMLAKALTDGRELKLLPRPAEWKMGAITFDTLPEAQHMQGAEALLRADLTSGRIRCALGEGETASIAKALYRTARLSLEENGANTLYLALGMLRWYESRRSQRPRYAPIILLPVEMVRRSAERGYVIRLRDDEPQMNITLLEKLKQDHAIQVQGVDPLPMTDKGIDIRRVLTILRQAVMDQPRWDVLETADIGVFSFSQFVMWNDIRFRTDDLMRNKVVRSLIDGKLAWDAAPMEMGDKVSEDDVLLPMPADASQLYAIRAACAGQTFVLHGPPGTGKSQTITSLIVNALAQGKRVLFVAEKMAALEVVQKRLDAIGVGPFCLELHSSRSRKRDVLEQLRRASEVTRGTSAERFAEMAEEIAAMRAGLDEYVRALHRPLACGSDLYTLINEYETLRDVADVPPFAPEYLHALTEGQSRANELLLEQAVAAGRDVGHPADHPLRQVGRIRYAQDLKRLLPGVVAEYCARLAQMTSPVQTLCAALGEPPVSDWPGLCRLAELAGDLACWYGLPTAWANETDYEGCLADVIRMAQHRLRAAELAGVLLQTYTPAFLEQDAETLRREWQEANGQWLLPRMMAMGRISRKLKPFARGRLDREKLPGHIETLNDYRQEMAAAAALEMQHTAALGSLYKGDATDWQRVADLAQAAIDSRRRLFGLTGNENLVRSLLGRADLRAAVYGVWNGMEPLTRAKQAIDELLTLQSASAADWLADQQTLCDALIAHAGEMKEWIAYAGAAHQARQAGLDNVISAYENGMPHENVLPACRKAVLTGLIARAIDESEPLNTFSGAVFGKKIDQYRRLDREWTELCRREAYCRLAARVPNFTREAAQSSELGILQRCIKSGGRGMSIRRLFDEIPNLLPRLCPCMLMSPISAAQYLDPKREPFDIVVFDEASQLPTCKAVGVLARGRDAVIVGDPKQMPPTAFFATQAVDEEHLDQEDLESILDDCLALNMPSTHLLWHYRSRHESLIAFSNSRFYENRLYTFPSVNDRASKVSLEMVDGLFERGKNRRNRAEAEAVVAEIIRRYRDPKLQKQSLGVVTFNISQQELIEDLLGDACDADEALEAWAYGAEEPIFIKNLENVQGDERDVILFSIGYGPDEKGRVYMNFGPLNRDGGWRRLNVAVSRARCEMKVFSTLRPEQIDLNRTQAEGVAALRAFLEYAQGRTAAVEEAAAPETNERCGVAEAICAALAEKGFAADLNVGRSAYRIDVGVIDPDAPERYLLGVMLDGVAYASARTTRDREIAQQQVLEGLGWNILRIWCMDWWDDRGKELQRILNRLDELTAPQIETETADMPQPEETEIPEDPETHPTAEAPAPPPADADDVPCYRAADLPETPMSAEQLLEPQRAATIRRRLMAVIEAEAPICETLVIRRVLQSCGIARTGSRIQAYMQALLRSMNVNVTTQGDTRVCWRADQDPALWDGVRAAGEGRSRRDVQEIPVQELANAACRVLNEQVSMGYADLIRETARKLGMTRVGGNVQTALEQGLVHAMNGGRIAIGENGKYLIPEPQAEPDEAEPLVLTN